MLEVVKVRALWCPCGMRLKAENDRALRPLLRKHLAWEHPYEEEEEEEEAPTNEQVKETVSSSAIYGYAYVPADLHEDLEEQGSGPVAY